jgi:hypothetical protein
MIKTILVSRITLLICIIIACGFVVWPLLKPGFIVTDDGNWMIIRLSAFAQSFRDGQIPTRFLGRLNYNYGYPVANFLYPGYLYIGTFIHYTGLSYIDSVKLILIISVLGYAIFLYLWLRKYFSHLASLTASMSSIWAPYLLFDLYHRGSVGEILGLFAGILTIFTIDSNISYLSGIAIALLIVSHNTFALMFLMVVLIYIVIFRLWNRIYSLFLGLGATAFFWLPALVEQRFIVFNSVKISNPFSYFANGSNLYLIGVVPIIFLIYVFIRMRKQLNKSQPGKFFIWVFIISVFLSTVLSAPLWMTPLAKIVQFPYRFLGVSLPFGAWIIAFVLDEIDKKFKLVLSLLVVLVMGLQLLPHFTGIRWELYPDGYYSTNEATTTVANEYMPRWVINYPQNRSAQILEIYHGNGVINVKHVTAQTIEADLNLVEKSIIQLNKIYYPGWGISINNEPAIIDYQNDNGVMRFMAPSGNVHIFAQFRETPFRFVVDIVSIGFTIILLGYVGFELLNLKILAKK